MEIYKIDPYRKYPFPPELEKWFEDVEKALGFKLFFWQKTFIERGVFRCYGETTARILRHLSEPNLPPLDLRGLRKRSLKDKIYLDELIKIKTILESHNIPIREVWITNEDCVKWHKRQEENKAQRLTFAPDCFDNVNGNTAAARKNKPWRRF